MLRKQIFFILFFLLTTALFAQENRKTFIERDTVDGVVQSIYIEDNRTSKYYDEIISFGFGLFDQQSYDNSIDYLKENELTLTRTVVKDFPKQWITLKQYKGKLYAYHPCDFLFHYKVSINDTTFIDWTGEGPIASKVIESKRSASKVLELTLTGIYQKDRKLIIHIIDSVRGIAVFQDESNKAYYLMIDAAKIRTVPIIINDCPVQKQGELNFEEPNYKKLLK